jgi:hypothetical protein
MKTLSFSWITLLGICLLVGTLLVGMDQGSGAGCQGQQEECSPPCQPGTYCAPCKTRTGVEYVCLPDGAVC